MKILIIDECYFTRNGIRHFFLKKNVRHEIIDMSSINDEVSLFKIELLVIDCDNRR